MRFPSKIHTTLLAFLAIQAVALADWWAPPPHTIIASKNGNFLLEVIPGDEGRGEAKARPCEAVLFEQRSDRQEGVPVSYAKQARFQLVNKQAPAAALVADSGEYIVTFDDWFEIGRGDNVVVIYKRTGEAVKRFVLKDFASDAEIKKMHATTSSIHWGGLHKIDAGGKLLILQVMLDAKPQVGATKARTVTIELATGKILTDGRP